MNVKLIIPHSVRKKDFGKAISASHMKNLQKAFFKPVQNLAGKNVHLPKNTKLIKVYGTSVEGAVRIVFLLVLKNGNKILLFHVPKKDKHIGENITPKNQAFTKELVRRLIQIQKDYREKKYTVISMTEA